MASSKKPKEENKKKESDSILAEVTKNPIKKPEKKASTTKKPNKSKPDDNKKKSSSETLVESDVVAHPSSSTESKGHEIENKTDKNGKPSERKQNVKVEETDEEEEEDEGKAAEEEKKMCRFPMNRIKRIIKREDSRWAVSQDVVFLVNKATENFLQQFCEDGFKCTLKDGKKSLSYKHLSTVVREQRRYDFLSDHVPEKIKAEDKLKERNLTETGAG